MVVIWAVGDVVVGHHDNIGFADAFLDKGLIRMENISLMTVVGETLRASDEDSPVGAVSDEDK